MTGWWEAPYKGGPMVPVPGFPRQLEVGDPDGPDAVAYKRTVWRACRWQGPASRFDDTYSDGFANGRGPNVIDTGIAGIQRQQNMPDTGVIDEKTFNTLRSIRVPEGKPHAGEMAMDATAQNLIGEAWQMFRPAAAAPETARQRALDGASRWIGYVEGPDNDSVFGSWYGANHQPYCAMAITYWYEVEAGGSNSFTRGSRYAYVPYIVSDAAKLSYGLSVTSSPVPGDLVCFDWQGDGTFDHVGLFSAWTANTVFETVEANTSPDSQGSQSNGGGVYRRSRDTRDQTTVFVRVEES
jgi:hypothetical protein